MCLHALWRQPCTLNNSDIFSKTCKLRRHQSPPPQCPSFPPMYVQFLNYILVSCQCSIHHFGYQSFSMMYYSSGYQSFSMMYYSGGYQSFSMMYYSGGYQSFSMMYYSGGYQSFSMMYYSGGYQSFSMMYYSSGYQSFSMMYYDGCEKSLKYNIFLIKIIIFKYFSCQVIQLTWYSRCHSIWVTVHSSTSTVHCCHLNKVGSAWF